MADGPQTKYPVTWELDSILPHPDKPEFESVFGDYKRRLTTLADVSDRLPAISPAAEHVAGWLTFLNEYAAVEKLASDLASFAGCHAAADAAGGILGVGEQGGEWRGPVPATEDAGGRLLGHVLSQDVELRGDLASQQIGERVSK